MTHPSTPLALPVLDTPTLVDADLAPLLNEPFASAWAASAALDTQAAQGLRNRLQSRVLAAQVAAQGFVTVRQRHALVQPLAHGVTQRLLYCAQAAAGTAHLSLSAAAQLLLRPGQPLRVRLFELEPGAALTPALLDDDAGLQREWLVLRGQVHAGDLSLSLRDYHVLPASCASVTWTAHSTSLLFLRESAPTAPGGDVPFTVWDAQAGWPDYAPGIQRRVLWQHNGQAAMLYYAQPGMQVPHHQHGHDEECLMVQGDLFLDDELLQLGDYQLAPAGSGHHTTTTDTGAVLYAHGDLDLQFVV